MTQPILLAGLVYAVEVPECMNAFKFDSIPEIDFYQLDCYELGEYNEPINEKSIDLPPGNWQLIGTTKECTEGIAAQIVERATGGISGRMIGFKDYVLTGLDMAPLSIALSSLRTLLISKKLDLNKNYVLLKRN